MEASERERKETTRREEREVRIIVIASIKTHICILVMIILMQQAAEHNTGL